jgi:transposase-like protein
MPNCPECSSEHIVKNGHIHNGKQNFLCRGCERQFVENPTQKLISQETKKMIDKLLLERISLAGIVRVTGVSEAWLQNYVNQKYESVPKKIEVSIKKKVNYSMRRDVVICW